jgi:hypothetical protein
VTEALRHRCRNQRCKTKLEVPTDNHHRAFCTSYCYNQFYTWRCKVCEKPILKGRRRKQPDHCHDHQCRREFRRYTHKFSYLAPTSQSVDYGSGSAHFTGLKTGISDGPRPRIIAGPQLSDFSLWAATLPDPKPQRAAPASWRMQHQPGDLAAEWAARELARREIDDAQYVAEDEARLQTEPVDDSGNFALRPRGVRP